MRTGNPTQLANALLAGEIDAALVAEPIAEAKFDWIVAFEEEPVIVTSHDHPLIDDSTDVPRTVIVFEHGCPHRRRLEEWYAERKDLPERTIELGSYHAMLGCVMMGMGAALVPHSVISTFPESKRLRVTRLPNGQNKLRTLMIWPKTSNRQKSMPCAASCRRIVRRRREADRLPLVSVEPVGPSMRIADRHQPFAFGNCRRRRFTELGSVILREAAHMHKAARHCDVRDGCRAAQLAGLAAG